MPFLTLEDPNAKIKGSRDPLGLVQIWYSFGRQVVTNLTTQTSSVRGFTVLILGRYLAARLIDEGTVPQEEALNVFLRFEQLAAYAREAVHGAGGDIRGIDRVRRNLQERPRKIAIQANRRGMILSDQKVYGLWGLFSVSARTSGLLSDGPVGVTERAAEFIESEYMPVLDGSLRPLLRLLARGGSIDTRRGDKVFTSIAEVLAPHLTNAEVRFYRDHLGNATAVQGVAARRQAELTGLLEQLDPDYIGREEILELRDRSRSNDGDLSHCLDRIARVEALLAPAAYVFDYCLTRDRQPPEDIAGKLEAAWGRVPNLAPSDFEELVPEIRDEAGKEVAGLARCVCEGLSSANYGDVIRALFDWNAVVMKTRKSGPWATLDEKGRVEIRYRGSEQLLPKADALPTLWRNGYFLDSLSQIVHQLSNSN